MTRIGHGALGARSALRTFEDLVGEASAARDAIVEPRPGMRLRPARWELHGGIGAATYRQRFMAHLGGMLRDVVGVESTVAPRQLTRVESIAESVEIAGSFFWDPDELVPGASYGDEVTTYGDGSKYGQRAPYLYVHLPDNRHAANASVYAQVGFYMAGRSVAHPELGPDKLAGQGGFEDWS